jgi:hypothetical protein
MSGSHEKIVLIAAHVFDEIAVEQYCRLPEDTRYRQKVHMYSLLISESNQKPNYSLNPEKASANGKTSHRILFFHRIHYQSFAIPCETF